MATSRVYLYETNFYASQNAILDNVESYLTSIGTVGYYYDFQYIKHGLDIKIKIPFTQDRTVANNINYVKIVNSDDNVVHYYYVIGKPEWLAQTTIELTLSLDTLNTFKDYLTFTNNTVIYRQHKDRFVKPDTVPSGSFTTSRLVDKVSEDTAGLQKYLTSDETVNYSLSKWYLVYCTSQSTNVSDTTTNVAIDCYLVPEDVYYTPALTDLTFEDILESQKCLILANADAVTVDGTTYTPNANQRVILARYSATTSEIHFFNIDNGEIEGGYGQYSNDSVITFTGTTYTTNQMRYYDPNMNGFEQMSKNERLVLWGVADKYYNTFYGTNSVELSKITSVNRTLSYLVKIIECPYAPINIDTAITNGTLRVVYTTFLNEDGMYVLKLDDINTEFLFSVNNNWSLNELSCSIPDNRITTNKSSYYESKLYNSEYFNYNFVYDSFVRSVGLENVVPNSTATPTLKIDYKQSNAVNSGLFFKFTSSNSTINKTDNLGQFLVCNRNNEMPIFNSSYLNYIRTGYNYDIKAKNNQISQGWINTGLNVAGAVGAFAISGLTGGISAAGGISLLTSSINSITNNIYAGINARNQIEQKLAEAKATASSVNGSDDLNLLNGYMGNKLKVYKYSISDEMKSKMYDLFYLTGYACNQTGIPNTTSRYRFNYVQCNPQFVFDYDPRLLSYIEDIKERFRKGVTYFHRYDDFKQTKENWEEWLITP